MNLRRLLYDELTVAKRSRRYAEPIDLRWMVGTEIETRKHVNRVRQRPRSGRFPLRLPWRR